MVILPVVLGMFQRKCSGNTRIYPNKEQRIQITKIFGCCRFVYNQTLAYQKETYEKENKFVSKTDCNHYCNRE